MQSVYIKVDPTVSFASVKQWKASSLPGPPPFPLSPSLLIYTNPPPQRVGLSEAELPSAGEALQEGGLAELPRLAAACEDQRKFGLQK